ncbi:WD40 repeat-like protein [Rhizopogon salebrosus TDB-379]|nr:WD40 repeat-like protein [Rhizopogon salebrosus TDB-379]
MQATDPTLTQSTTATTELSPVVTFEGHKWRVLSLSYFPNGKQIISGCIDRTTRRWDLQAGREIEEARDICDQAVWAVEVSRDGRWVITAGGDVNHAELKAREVETGIVKTFQGHSKEINCIDISADCTLLVSGSADRTLRIWSLNSGKLVAGPFESDDRPGAIRFSKDSKKLAVRSFTAKCLDVWDVQTQKLDERVGKLDGRVGLSVGGTPTYAPVFWTKEDESILAVFGFTEDHSAPTSIYEFDASTLETLGAPFEGHTRIIYGLALSSDCALLASASYDNTIKLWAFESRQIIASFHALNPLTLILSPSSHQLAYTALDDKVYVCDIPANIIATIWPEQDIASINDLQNPMRPV